MPWCKGLVYGWKTADGALQRSIDVVHFALLLAAMLEVMDLSTYIVRK